MPGDLCRRRGAAFNGAVIQRLWRAVAGYPRRSPVTTGYLILLAATHVWLDHGVSALQAARITLAVSTNLDNLSRDPVGVLFGSLLFFDGTLVHPDTLLFAGTLITLVLGIGGVAAYLERRNGAPRTYAVFLTGHIGATLITSQVIRYALTQGWYPQSVRHTYDYGISYGAEALLAAAVFVLPKALRAPWAVFVLVWPVLGASQFTPILDFTTIGHLTSALIGFALGALGVLGRGRQGPDDQPSDNPSSAPANPTPLA